jgi:hypothetical protein
MSTDCPIAIANGVLALFNADQDVIEAYGKTYTASESENVTLVKSDNGWVIQN